MTAEAALMGVPSISAYPAGSYLVEDFLVKRGLVKKARGEKAILGAVQSMLRDEDYAERIRRGAAALRRGMVNPVAVIAEHVASQVGGNS
jgi:predicted glycosyltransferase